MAPFEEPVPYSIADDSTSKANSNLTPSPTLSNSAPSIPPTASLNSLTISCPNPSLPTWTSNPIVLHIGDPIKYNPAVYAEFSSKFTVIRPSLEERQRDEFKNALQEKRWGDFSAIFRPFWNTGGEMGRWDRELIECLPQSVKVFASAGAGFDWADVDVLGEHGIIYCNSATATTEAVADFTLFGILSVFRALPYCISSAMYPSPSSPTTASTTFLQCHKHATALSRNPRNHTLGVIGLGNIGKAIAKKAHAAFGMKILYFDVSKKSSDIESEAGNAVFCATLLELLGNSDCVVLATPSNPSGAKTINASTLAHFKPESRFVNIARGSLVDEEALADALEEGRLSAVMLDVHEAEPVVNERLLRLGRERGNVMLTCHNAGGTVDTHVEFERLGMVNIAEVLEGRGTGSAVNLQWLRRGGEERL